jgi:bud site selection protein 31
MSETLDGLQSRMREAEQSDTAKLRKDELLWPIFRLHHQRTRYVYEMHYVKGEVSKECVDFAIKQGYADAGLMAKWKKQGFEKLCCLRCIQPKDTNFATACVCRVPKKDLEEGKLIECTHCGCRGCASSDA